MRRKRTGKEGSDDRGIDGYARNFLFPQKKAIAADAKARNELKGKEEAKQYKIEEDKKAAVALAEKIKDKTVTIKMGHGQDGRLYGSVTSKDIATELEKLIGCAVDKRKINLKDSIKAYGKYDVEIKVHPEVTAKFVVSVEQ